MCIVVKVVSPLLKSETIEDRRMAPREACANEMLAVITWHDRNLAVRLF
jgi:hypothetical protein